MLIITQTALELGFLYALVALALFLSYRILDIADLTTDGCFVLGAAVSVSLTAAGHPFLAIPAAMLAGACAGLVTAFLQTKPRRAEHPRGHRDEYGTLHRESHGDGVEGQPEPARVRHRVHAGCAMLASAGHGMSCCLRSSLPDLRRCCCAHFSVRISACRSARRAIIPTWCARRR